MSLSLSRALSCLNSDSYLPSASAPSSSSSSNFSSITCSKRHQKVLNGKVCLPPIPFRLQSSSATHICRAAEYKFPNPIPEFANAEIEKFRSHMLKRLAKKGHCGDSVDEVVEICTDILSTFLHSEYGGPGTLLVIPFIDIADTINEKGLPGGPQAARIAVKWAQDHVDKDWNQWNGES